LSLAELYWEYKVYVEVKSLSKNWKDKTKIKSELYVCLDDGRLLSYIHGAWQFTTHHFTRHNMPIHNILSTAPQLSISQKTLGTLLEDGNVVPKHVGATIHN
jgi:hypothetical protein